MVRTVYLKEEVFAVKMLRSVKDMMFKDDFCDFTVRVKRTEFNVHRVVLAAGSPYFKAMLKHDTTESRGGKVEMKEVDAKCVKSCIDFMYSGKFDIPDGKMDKLLHVAIMMQLEDIKTSICNILTEELNAENFYETRSIAEMYQLSSIMKNCREYYEENFMAISTQPGFQNEQSSNLVNILKSKRLKLSEEEKLDVSLKWVGNNHEKKKDLLKLIECINLKDVSLNYLSDLLQNHPIICHDLFLYKLINDPLVQYFAKNAHDKNSHVAKFLVLFDFNSDCLQSYNPTTNEVSKFHEAKFKHLKDFTAVSMDSYIYVLRKNKSIHRLNFEDKTSQWEKMQDMIADHGLCPPSVSFSGSLYVLATSASPTKDFEKYDPIANKWLRLEDKPLAVQRPAVVSLDDSIYCIGGWGGSKELNELCKFTPSTSKWVDLEPMKMARGGCGAVAVNQKIFVMGGRCGPEIRSAVECYDVISRQWTSLSPMIEVNGTVNSHHFNGSIFSVSRFASAYGFEKYDIANDRWDRIEFKGHLNCKVYDSLSVCL